MLSNNLFGNENEYAKTIWNRIELIRNSDKYKKEFTSFFKNN